MMSRENPFELGVKVNVVGLAANYCKIEPFGAIKRVEKAQAESKIFRVYGTSTDVMIEELGLMSDFVKECEKRCPVARGEITGVNCTKMSRSGELKNMKPLIDGVDGVMTREQWVSKLREIKTPCSVNILE